MITNDNLQQKLDFIHTGPSTVFSRLVQVDATPYLFCARALDEYLAHRAEIVGDDYDLAPGHYLAWLLTGERCFFGVRICPSHMRPILDYDEPFPGCFEEWVDFVEGRTAHEELVALRELLYEAGVASESALVCGASDVDPF